MRTIHILVYKKNGYFIKNIRFTLSVDIGFVILVLTLV